MSMLQKIYLGTVRKFIEQADFLFLVLVVFLINFPYLRPDFIPRHDTLFCYEVFYNIYNEFFYHHDIVQWMPYGVYGVPYTYWQIGAITPVDYFVCFIGKILAFKNTLILFKLAILLNQYVFLLGLYFLANYLFKNRITTILVCLACFCSLEWFSQVLFNFRLYYYCPWVVYFLLLFFQFRKAGFFWISCIIGVIGAIGSSWYYSVLWLFIFCIFCCAMFIFEHVSFKDIIPRSKRAWFCLGVLSVLLISYFYFLRSSFDHALIWGRAETGANSLNVFLTYAGNFNFDLFVTFFTYNWVMYSPVGSGIDNTIYAGFSAMFFFIWAILFVRNRLFFAFLITTLVLIWFSFSGLVTTIAYYFPGMKYYRHIGLVYGLVKVLVAFCAGFGINDILKSPWKEMIKKIALVTGIYVLLIDMNETARFLFIGTFSKENITGFWLHPTLNHVLFFPIFFFCVTYLCLITVLLYALTCQLKKKPLSPIFTKDGLAMLLIVIALIDVVSFQRNVFLKAPVLPYEAHRGLKAVEVNELKFVDSRSSTPVGQRQKLAWSLEKGTAQFGEGKYDTLYSILQMDFCNDGNKSMPDTYGKPLLLRDVLKTDLQNGQTVLARPQKDTVNTNLVASSVMLLSMAQIPHTSSYDSIIGCGKPKIRLLGSGLSFSDNKNIEDYMRTHTNFDKIALVNAGTERQIPDFKKEDQASPGQFFVKDFTTNEISIEVNVKQKRGAWLIYADAFHPGWHAYIDRRPTTITQAYLAFKGVFIPEGKHLLRFVFFNGIVSVLSYFIALVGLLSGAFFVILFLLRVFLSYDLTNIFKRLD